MPILCTHTQNSSTIISFVKHDFLLKDLRIIPVVGNVKENDKRKDKQHLVLSVFLTTRQEESLTERNSTSIFLTSRWWCLLFLSLFYLLVSHSLPDGWKLSNRLLSSMQGRSSGYIRQTGRQLYKRDSSFKRAIEFASTFRRFVR